MNNRLHAPTIVAINIPTKKGFSPNPFIDFISVVIPTDPIAMISKNFETDVNCSVISDHEFSLINVLELNNKSPKVLITLIKKNPKINMGISLEISFKFNI